jgi:hypothetical protein
MKIRFALPCALVALVAALSLTAASATAAPATQPVTAAITPAQSGGALNGVFTIANFALNDAGQLVANGTFTGTLTQASGVTNLVNEAVSTVISNAGAAPGASCQILDLTLGPLHLNLLGLVIDLNQVHLNITAVPGPGNLLGNLLCAVTHLLDNTGASNNALQNLVNQLNNLLAGLGL